MGNCCNSQAPVRSWNDLALQMPVDPRDIIAYAAIGGTAGRWYLSSDYNLPAGSSVWINTPVSYASAAVVSTNATDQQQQVFDATAYNFLNASVNILSTTAPPLRKTIFLRAGIGWTNGIPLACGSSPLFTEFQLSLLDNAATRGDAQGTIPVFRFASGTYSGTQNLTLVFKVPGRYSLGLMGINNNSTPDYSMFEMDVVVV